MKVRGCLFVLHQKLMARMAVARAAIAGTRAVPELVESVKVVFTMERDSSPGIIDEMK